jgi:hypothetical protein
MMVSRQKRKGSDFERQIVDLLNTKLSKGEFKRIPSSGSIGTIMGESLLTGDVSGFITGFPSKIKAECKSGYSNRIGAEAKSLTLEKKWLDKIKEEAETAYNMPIFFGKFDNVRQGVRYFVAFDFDTFIGLANHITELQSEIDKIYDKQKLAEDKG